MDFLPAEPSVVATRVWADLDEPWQEAFRQAWEALRTGNVAVGACVSTAEGEIVRAARNRLNGTSYSPRRLSRARSAPQPSGSARS